MKAQFLASKPNQPHEFSMYIATFLIAIMFSAATALAGPGHDHGDAAPATSGTASAPRMSSHSDLFELVAVAQRGALEIYLDRYASNEPVLGATIEVEAGKAKGLAMPQTDGSYRFAVPAPGLTGTVPLSFTVIAGKESDLLAGELVIADTESSDAHGSGGHLWERWLAYAAGAGVVALLAAAVLAARRHHRATSLVVVGSAILLVAVLFSPAAHAGPGHDHGDSAPAATGNSPKRLADGSVFLPKPSQRQLALRTVVAEEKALPITVELTGRVVSDPSSGGKVQPTQAGRIEAGPRGLPHLGQTVRKGEALVIVRAASGAIERANQVAQTAELQANLAQARRRVARLEQLEGTVAQKDVDAARVEADSLAQRLAAVSASVSATEVLVAPVSGVIAATHVVMGQVVEAREVLFEIVDPSRLRVEASAFDTALLGNVAGASASPAAGVAVPLRFVGAGSMLREGAIPLQFAITAPPGSVTLAVHQPVKVVVQTKTQVKGFALPTGALVKSPGNQDMVWVHTGAELFQPRPVRFMPLDGATVSVVDGLKAGDRVVTQGAALVNQVR